MCTEAYDALRVGADRPPLQPYGATNPAEFFAVATEAFFDVPLVLEHHEPDLYEIMRDFYRQDPAARSRPRRAGALIVGRGGDGSRGGGRLVRSTGLPLRGARCRHGCD